MKSNKTEEKLAEFKEKVIGISLVNAVPVGVIVFHDGALIGASLGKDQSISSIYSTQKGKEIGSSITAPDGMYANIILMRYSKDTVKDFQMIREVVDSYEVTSLEFS